MIFHLSHRTLLDQTVSELKHQVSLLKSRESKVIDQNRELQHTMIDMETKLEDMQERNQTALDMVRHASPNCQKTEEMNELDYCQIAGNINVINLRACIWL